MVVLPVELTLGARRPLGGIEQVGMADSVLHRLVAVWTMELQEFELAQFLGGPLESARRTSDHELAAFVRELILAGRTAEARGRPGGQPRCTPVERASCVGDREGQGMGPFRVPPRVEQPSHRGLELVNHRRELRSPSL